MWFDFMQGITCINRFGTFFSFNSSLSNRVCLPDTWTLRNFSCNFWVLKTCFQNKFPAKQFTLDLALFYPSLTKPNNGNARTRTLRFPLLPTLQGNPNNCSSKFQYYCTSSAALAVHLWYKFEWVDDRPCYLSVDSLSHLHSAMRDGDSAVVLEHGDRGVVVAIRVQRELHRHQTDSPLLPNICLEKQRVS